MPATSVAPSAIRPVPRADATPVVATRELTKQFDDREVIHRLDLEIERGTIVGLIGPSGCGKTTTVRLMTGLLSPTTGVATVDGTPSTELSSAQRSRIGYLPQTPALFPDLSLAENLSFHASMYGLPFRRRARIDELLDWVELSDHRRKRVADCSGGMQRRLALAAAFVQDPDLVFLDEPTAGIDPILRDKLWKQFRSIAEAGKTLIVTTQYVGEAGECDLVGLLSDGELLLLDTPENLRRAAFAGEVVDVRLARPATDAEVAALAAEPFVVGQIERPSSHELRVVVDDAAAALSDLGGAFERLGATVVDLSEHVVDYDEAFVRVVERHRHSIDAGEHEADDLAEPDGDARADVSTDDAEVDQ